MIVLHVNDLNFVVIENSVWMELRSLVAHTHTHTTLWMTQLKFIKRNSILDNPNETDFYEFFFVVFFFVYP